MDVRNLCCLENVQHRLDGPGYVNWNEVVAHEPRVGRINAESLSQTHVELHIAPPFACSLHYRADAGAGKLALFKRMTSYNIYAGMQPTCLWCIAVCCPFKYEWHAALYMK